MEKEIAYAGKRVRLVTIYDERREPRWQDDAQERINFIRSDGRAACCIHDGVYHGLYAEEFYPSPISGSPQESESAYSALIDSYGVDDDVETNRAVERSMGN